MHYRVWSEAHQTYNYFVLTAIKHAANEKDIDLAVAAARKAFNTTWGKNVTGPERSRLMNKFADLIERDQEALAALESLNNGKPMRFAKSVSDTLSLSCNHADTECAAARRDFDIADSIQCLRYYAGWADKITGQVSALHFHCFLRSSGAKILSKIACRQWRSITRPSWHLLVTIPSGYVVKCMFFFPQHFRPC
jgi:acyl-CoA reductase-like NAD-dependent aldehyde dehydrogenase